MTRVQAFLSSLATPRWSWRDAARGRLRAVVTEHVMSPRGMTGQDPMVTSLVCVRNAESLRRPARIAGLGGTR